MVGLVEVELIAALQHAGVNLDDLLLNQSHVTHRHEVQHVLAV